MRGSTDIAELLDADFSLPTVSFAYGSLAECAQFGDGSSLWGPVETANVMLGGEPEVQVPIQIIDSTFGRARSACAGLQPGPSAAGFNGILGIGMFAVDCGPACASSSSNGMYFTCSGSNCTGAAGPSSYQVQNPVALLPQDNNGVAIQLPSIPKDGAPSVDGYLVLGIGTRTNNVPSAGAARLSVNRYGYLSTSFAGVAYQSFIDTGSSGLFFSPPSSSQLPNCPSPATAWYCPSSAASFSATNSSYLSSAPDSTVSFQIGSFLGFTGSSNRAAAEIGGNAIPSGGLDWGLPFFFRPQRIRGARRNRFEPGHGSLRCVLGSGARNEKPSAGERRQGHTFRRMRPSRLGAYGSGPRGSRPASFTMRAGRCGCLLVNRACSSSARGPHFETGAT